MAAFNAVAGDWWWWGCAQWELRFGQGCSQMPGETGGETSEETEFLNDDELPE